MLCSSVLESCGSKRAQQTESKLITREAETAAENILCLQSTKVVSNEAIELFTEMWKQHQNAESTMFIRTTKRKAVDWWTLGNFQVRI